MTDTLYAGLIISHCSAIELVLQETGPTTAAESNLHSTKKAVF